MAAGYVDRKVIVMDKKKRGKRGLIETGVDKLVKLVEERKKISVKDAARDLGVSVASVEEWAEFLEDAGLIYITSKFATVYLVEKKLSAREIKERLHEAKEEKETFMRRVESSMNAVSRDEDEIKLIESEFKKIKDLLEGSVEHLDKKLDSLGNFKTAQRALDSKSSEVERECAGRIKQLEGDLKKASESYSKVTKDIHDEMERIKGENEKLKALNEAKKDLKSKADELNRLIAKVSGDIEGETDEINRNEDRLEKSRKEALKIKDAVDSTSSELTELTKKLKSSREEFEKMEADFKKDLAMISEGNISKIDAYRESKAAVDKFRKFLESTKDVEKLIKTAEHDEDDLKRRMQRLAEKAKGFSMLRSSAKVRSDLESLEKELVDIDAEKTKTSDSLRKLRLFMRSLSKR